MSDKPDWGHGPNPPVLTFTEEQIRAVLKEHGVSTDGSCLCSWSFLSTNHSQEFDADHFIEKLKETT